jgi:hypothetical protein
VVVCFITSVARTGPDDASSSTGLKACATVRFDKLATLEKSVMTTPPHHPRSHTRC